MSVPYTSYEAAVIQSAIAMLSASATFGTLVPSLKVPADIIVESVGGFNPNATSATAVSGNVISIPLNSAATTNFAVVHEAEFDTTEIALYTFGHSGVVGIQLYTLQVGTDLPPEVLRRARNYAGAISSEINALFGQSGYFMRGECKVASTVVLDETTDLKGYCQSILNLSWKTP